MKIKLLNIIACILLITIGCSLASGSTTKEDNTYELSIRGGIGRCVFTVTNNGNESVLSYAHSAIGGILKQNDQVGFLVPGNGQKSLPLYMVRPFAPINASLVVGDQIVRRTGFIIGLFVIFTS
jgi:hypothetical protein